jgi:DNA invertase Pin-like site-specific DNA recombinase
MSEKKITALYARVSTGNQGTGLESQIRALRNYCNQKGIEHFMLYQDENQSGVKYSRPALDKMMKAVRNKEIGQVIVYSFSRYARSTSHLLSALEEFKKLEVEFVSVSENIETNSPLGVAVFSILGAVATLERDILVERVKNGLANAKAKGVKLGRKKTRDSELIRRLYLSGVTYRTIGSIARCSSGAVSAEVRELKKELEEKKELEGAMKNREFEAVKTELERTRARVVTLEGKVPEGFESGKGKGESATSSHASDNPKPTGEPMEVVI